MLSSLRQAGRLLASQPCTLARMFSSQASAVSSFLQQQPLSLGSLFGMQPAAAAVPQLGWPGLLPPSAAAALPLSLQQQQSAPALLPELADILGGLEGE